MNNENFYSIIIVIFSLIIATICFHYRKNIVIFIKINKLDRALFDLTALLFTLLIPFFIFVIFYSLHLISVIFISN